MKRENRISESFLGGLDKEATSSSPPNHLGLGTLPDWLLWRSTVSPERLALKYKDTELSFAELQEETRTLSGVLVWWGIKKGNRVCLLLNSSILYVALIHALTRIGAIIVPLNPRQSSSEILLQINDCSPSLVLYDRALIHIVREIQSKSTDQHVIRSCHFRRSEELTEIRHTIQRNNGGEIESSSPHSIIYTSGSTGDPKGVVITASNLMWNAISFGIYHGALSSDKWLLVMPLYHVGGYTIIFRSVILGSSIVIHSKFDANAVSRSVDRDQITLLSLVPTMLESILKIRKESFPERFRLIFLGGSHTPLSLINKIIRKKLPVLLTYGMTESCSQIAISKVGSASGNRDQNSYHAMFPTTMKIGLTYQKKQDKRRRTSAHKVGRILLRGPSIFSGYWGNQNVEPHFVTFENGWFDTGDVGYVDTDGRFSVLGRENEMIISGGENIYPIEVESPLLEHKAVQDVAVIGRVDPKWGQRVEAVLKIKPNCNRPSSFELNKFLRERIGSYKIPKAYHFLREFPKTQSGKTKRTVIREIVEGMEEQRTKRVYFQ